MIVSREDYSETTKFVFEAPHALARFIASKGSVALDGTSLTVNGVDGDRFDCLLIPHTLKVTTWGGRKVGDRINLEVDTIARYVARIAGAA
jgi:riboflavin synthase